MEYANKVTPSFLSNGIALKSIDKDVYLGRIYGIAGKVIEFTTQFGNQEKLEGEFVGIRAKDSQACTAGTCILPIVGMKAISDALKSAKGVKFGFDIFATPSKTSGYSWKLVSLMDMEPVGDSLEFAKKFPTMPTPEPVPEGQAVPASRGRKPKAKQSN